MSIQIQYHVQSMKEGDNMKCENIKCNNDATKEFGNVTSFECNWSKGKVLLFGGGAELCPDCYNYVNGRLI